MQFSYFSLLLFCSKSTFKSCWRKSACKKFFVPSSTKRHMQMLRSTSDASHILISMIYHFPLRRNFFLEKNTRIFLRRYKFSSMVGKGKRKKLGDSKIPHDISNKINKLTFFDKNKKLCQVGPPEKRNDHIATNPSSTQTQDQWKEWVIVQS